MLDVLFLAVFVALPVATWLVTRSLTWTSTHLILAFGLGGNAVQTTISWGLDWSVREMQGLSLGLMLVVLGLGLVRRRRGVGAGTRVSRQFWGVVFPALVIGAFLLGMRLLAPETASPLAGVGYLINHPLAEDNAKWLHLTSQLATGEAITFNGYAGGPLLLLMAVVSSLVSVLSMVLLGGVNEVAVAVNTLIVTQFLLIALVPFALAPLVEGALGGRGRRSRVRIPLPVLWTGALVLFVASAVVTSYGHLSFQFILIVLTLWAAVFLVPGRDPFARIVMTLAIATSASVWVPLNVIGLALVLSVLGWSVWRRHWRTAMLAAFTLVVSWDALLSSTLYLLGLNGADSVASSASEGSGVVETVGSSAVSLPPQVLAATHLFEAPGGTEIVQPLLGGLALVSVLIVVARHPRVTVHATRLRGFAPILPVVALGAYAILLSVGDGIITGSAPHYGGHKLAFAWTVMALAATLPIAITLLEPRVSGMTVLRWMAMGAVFVLLMLDTMLPRAVSALSPKLWPGADASSPAYWVPAEVRNQPVQLIESLPVACIFVPPQVSTPSALPLGQQAYTCTRLLTGLNGLEGRAGTISAWLATDWQSNQQTWAAYYPSLVETTRRLSGREVILMTPEYGVAGLAPWNAVLDRHKPPSAP